MPDELPKSEFSPDRNPRPLPMPEPSRATPPSEWRAWLDSKYNTHGYR